MIDIQHAERRQIKLQYLTARPSLRRAGSLIGVVDALTSVIAIDSPSCVWFSLPLYCFRDYKDGRLEGTTRRT